MSLWIVVGNRHHKLKAGTYVRLYDDHFREQRVIQGERGRFTTEDASAVEWPLSELKDKVFPIGQKRNRAAFKSALGYAYLANQRVEKPPSPLILPGDEDFSL